MLCLNFKLYKKKNRQFDLLIIILYICLRTKHIKSLADYNNVSLLKLGVHYFNK